MGAATNTQLFGFGRMIANPTSADSSAAYGGTELGTVGAVALRPRTRSAPHRREDLGGQVSDLVYLGDDVDAICVFNGWDSDALAKIHHSTSGTLVTLGAKTVGSWLGADEFALLYAPEDAAAPGFYLPRVVRMHERLEIPFSGFLPVAHAMRFLGLPPASGNLGRIGLIANLTGGWV